MADSPAWYEQILDAQLRVNADVWAQLRARGVGADTRLQLGFAYLSPGREQAEGLTSFLAAETDYVLEAREQDGRWYVFGVTQPTTVSRELLDDWAQWMIASGAVEGPCAFDGWEVVGGLGSAPAGE